MWKKATWSARGNCRRRPEILPGLLQIAIFNTSNFPLVFRRCSGVEKVMSQGRFCRQKENANWQPHVPKTEHLESFPPLSISPLQPFPVSLTSSLDYTLIACPKIPYLVHSTLHPLSLSYLSLNFFVIWHALGEVSSGRQLKCNQGKDQGTIGKAEGVKWKAAENFPGARFWAHEVAS